jgi:hypothetical protein
VGVSFHEQAPDRRAASYCRGPLEDAGLECIWHQRRELGGAGGAAPFGSKPRSLSAAEGGAIVCNPGPRTPVDADTLFVIVNPGRVVPDERIRALLDGAA